MLLLIHHRDFFDSSDQITLNLHYHRRIGRFSLSRNNQFINIKASGLSSPRQDIVEEGTGEQISM
jgi:hypothetical protein